MLHHFNHRGRCNAVMNQAISMNKPALVLTHSAINICCPSARVHPAYGCRHQQIPRYRAEGARASAKRWHPAAGLKSPGFGVLLSWHFYCLLTAIDTAPLTVISQVYHSAPTHPFAIAAAKKINTSVCHWQKHPKRSINIMRGRAARLRIKILFFCLK